MTLNSPPTKLEAATCVSTTKTPKKSAPQLLSGKSVTEVPQSYEIILNHSACLRLKVLAACDYQRLNRYNQQGDGHNVATLTSLKTVQQALNT